MIPHAVTLYRTTIATLALIFLPGVSVARAQDASPWKKEIHAAARLIAGAARMSGDTVMLRAGVEVRLDPGWHTYWRDPGDSGVPPTFDFTGSENIKSVIVLWPAPKRFPDGAGGHSNGYLRDVVFPLRIAPEQAAQPALLRLKLHYAFCKNICFPAEADLVLRVSGEGGAEEEALVAAEARVPRRVPLGVGRDLAIRSVHRETIDGHQRVFVEVTAQSGMPVDLFIEGPTPDWALVLPELANSTPGPTLDAREFSFDLNGLSHGASAAGATLRFTAVSSDNAIEVHVHLK